MMNRIFLCIYNAHHKDIPGTGVSKLHSWFFFFSYVDNIHNFWLKKIAFGYFILSWNQKGLQEERTGNKIHATQTACDRLWLLHIKRRLIRAVIQSRQWWK